LNSFGQSNKAWPTVPYILGIKPGEWGRLGLLPRAD
jgi:hypothetical protein